MVLADDEPEQLLRCACRRKSSQALALRSRIVRERGNGGLEHGDGRALDHTDGKFHPRRLAPEELAASPTAWQDALAHKGWNSLYLSNHDQPRPVTRFGGNAYPSWLGGERRAPTVGRTSRTRAVWVIRHITGNRLELASVGDCAGRPRRFARLRGEPCASRLRVDGARHSGGTTDASIVGPTSTPRDCTSA